MHASPGLYVHLPWCIRKCPYCDFNSHAVRGETPYQDYVHALLRDLRHQVDRYRPAPFASVFFGGGTPSLFAPEHIAQILDVARAVAGIEDGAEITLEANPGAVEHGSFAGYREAGVNRVSLGIQSFNPSALKALGRVHTDNDAHRAIHAVQAAGIRELNLDLMYGLPDQTVDEAAFDVRAVIEAGPTHVSHYQLTIEPNTLFAVRTPTLPSEETMASMQVECQALLARAGYAQYEVSAYARPGFEGRHNLNYWRFGDYLGVGAGAHGKVTQDESVVRTLNAKHPTQFMQQPEHLTETPSSESEQLFEFMLNRLRLNRPLSAEERAAFAFLQSDQALCAVQQATDRGLMEIDHVGTWQRTPLGARFLNDLQALFLP